MLLSFSCERGRAMAASEPLLDKFEQPPLGVSRFRINARIGLTVEAVLVIATIVWMWHAYHEGTLTLDPVGIVCAGYVCIVLAVQLKMMEWPVWSRRVYTYIIMSLGSLCLPSLFNHIRCKSWGLRATSSAMNVVIAYAVWAHTVRGPTYKWGKHCLKGKCCIITGCNTGIGKITAATFAKAGAKVIFACRTESKAREAMDDICRECSDLSSENLVFLQLDVSSLASVRRFAEEYKRAGYDVDVLCLNAGSIISRRDVSVDGFDLSMATNHFGHFLLVMLLLPVLLATEQRKGTPRIVQITSATIYEHKNFDFDEAAVVQEHAVADFRKKPLRGIFKHYSMTKLASMLVMQELVHKLKDVGSKIPCHLVHPGEINTDVTRDLPAILVKFVKRFPWFVEFFLKTPWQGHIGTVFACTSDECATSDQMTGRVLFRLHPMGHSSAWEDQRINQHMWDISQRFTSAPDVPHM